jgi:hypothetical protein
MKNMKRHPALLSGAAAILSAAMPLSSSWAAGNLTVEIISAYNLVVDSNITTPATYAPSAATVGAKICNTDDVAVTDVHAYIGDYKGGVGDTPGTYPVFNSAGDSRDWLKDTGSYSLKQESGSFSSASDASRAWVGTIQPGECKVEYWVVSYPQCVNVGGQPQSPPCDASITGGSTTADDLTLYYDVWATGTSGGAAVTADATQGLTLRSEISASANKIWPNGDNKVPDEYKNAISEQLGWDIWTPTGSTAYPGQVIRTQGIWYDLGNVNQGFDNNGDGVPDNNAWLQPVGDPSVYDPGCFRLVRTFGLLIVKLSNGGEQLIPFENQMYFENLPDNTGVVGLVFYEYAALNGACTGTLSPYQEVASGYLNEKFSGDYGTGYQMQTQEPLASITKGVAPENTSVGSTLTYTLEVANPATSAYSGLTVTVGEPDSGTPLVIRDAIPAGTKYVWKSAAVASGSGIPAADVEILYSYDNGATWTSAAPADQAEADTVTNLQWRAKTTLDNASTMKVEFQATVPGTYNAPLVSNTGCAAIGTAPCFDEDDAVALIAGTASITGTVFKDVGTGSHNGNGTMDAGDFGEGGMSGVPVNIYYDTDGSGGYTEGDYLWTTLTTDVNGQYTTGNTLPPGNWIVVVGTPPGSYSSWASTTGSEHFIDNLASGGSATAPDTGFSPALTLDKKLVSPTPIKGGDAVSYTIDLNNTLYGVAGTGTANSCTRDVYAQTYLANNSATNYLNGALGAPQGNCTSPATNCTILPFSSNSDYITVGGYAADPSWGNITSLQVVVWADHDESYSPATRDDAFNLYITNTATSTTSSVSGFAKNIPVMYDGTEHLVYGSYVTGDIKSSFPGVVLSDLANFQVKAETQKDGGNPAFDIEIDAIGLRITTNKPCYADSTIISPLPLYDTFDANKLQFVSATPAPDRLVPYDDGDPATDMYRLEWDNLGPLNPSQSTHVTVNFTAVEPIAEDTIINKADVTNAFFANGTTPTNTAHDEDVADVSPTALIGDFIWYDTNNDGSWQDGESGIPGVDIYLCTSTNPCVSGAADAVKATTDSSGKYQFEYLADDTYYLAVDTSTLPDGFTTTPTGSRPVEVSVDISGSVDNMNQDWGFNSTTGTIVGSVWQDFDGDASRDGNDTPFAGWQVKLYDSGNNLVGTATTNADGTYSFGDLLPGNYYTTVTPPSGSYIPTYDYDGSPNSNSGIIPISSGTFVSKVDFAYQTGTNSIGDRLYSDLNGDGDDEGGAEPGIPNVTINLYQDSGTIPGVLDPGDVLLGSDVTDGNGNYGFSNLPDGDYLVVVDENDSDFPQAQQTKDPDETGVCSVCNGTAVVDNLSGGTDNSGIDFGYKPDGGTIGDSIFWDVNGDGSQGLNEPGIAGVEVKLYTFTDADGDGRWDTDETLSATPYRTAVTDANGNYLFPGLPDGNYLVEVGTIVGNPQLTADPDADGAICPAAGAFCDDKHGVKIIGNTYMGADFGYEPPLFIGDQLFIDSDRSGGAMDANDAPIAYVTITLRDCGDNGTCGDGDDAVYTTETDENGNYAFVDHLVSGHNYTITVDTTTDPDFPSGLGVMTPSYNGTVDTDGALNNSITLTNLGSAPVDTADFGYQFPAVNNLSGTICLEGAGPDGVCGTGTSGVGTGETAYAGTTVYVSKWTDDGDGVVESGELIALAQGVTEPNGDYSFTGLPSVSGANESYVVSLAAPESYLNLTTEFGDTPAASVNKSLNTAGYTASAWQKVDVIDGSNTTGLDFAFSRAVQFDFGDLPLPFETTLSVNGARHIVPATLNLYLGASVGADADGSPSAGANADASDNGIVQVGTWTEGKVTDTPTSHGGKISVTTYGQGWFIGWIDFNGDGSFSGSGEMIVSQELGTAGASLTTDIPFDIPTGGLNSPGYARFRFFPSEPPVPALAFKGVAENGEVEDYWFQQFFSTPSSIGDQILYDSDGNGVPDQGLEGVVVELQNAYCNPGVDCPTATTDADGHYVFSGVGLGEYTVAVVQLPTISGVTLTQIYDPDGTLDGKTPVTISTAGTVYTDADFWYSSSATPSSTGGIIGDRIWNDADGDGVQDMGESGIGGLTVELQNGTCTPSTNCPTTTTAADGSYMFTGVQPGDYTVTVTPPVGATQTGDPDVPNASCGGSCDGKTTTAITITATGEKVLTADFGYQYPPANTTTIGSLIWSDANKDSVQDADEAGIGGVTVVLKKDDGSGNIVIVAQTVTDGNGNYSFPGILPGTYTVEVTDTNDALGHLVSVYEKDGIKDGSHTVTVSSDVSGLVCSTSPATTPTYTCANQVNFGYGEPSPTYALLSSFKAYVNDKNQTVLEWKTDSEIGTLGFLLDRLNEQSGEYEAVTDDLLPGMLTPPQGGTYRYVDTAAEPGAEHTYRVVEVAVNGEDTVSGPYKVKAEEPLPDNRKMIADGPEGFSLAQESFSVAQISRAAARSKAVNKLAAQKKKKTGMTVKVPVSTDGLVYVSASDLAAASGLSKAKVAQHLNAGKGQITLAGETVPALHSKSGLWFYGQAPERSDIGRNIYLVNLGKKGAKIKTSPAQPKNKDVPVQSFAAKVEAEKNLLPLHAYLNTPVKDFWAWEYLLAYKGEAAASHTVDAPHLTGGGTAALAVNLVAVSNSSTGSAAPYKVSIFLNGSHLGTEEWSERGDRQFRKDISAELLKESGNEVKIVSSLNSNVTWSFIYLDSIEVEYQRSLQADNGELRFKGGQGKKTSVTGLKSGKVLAFDITEPAKPVRLKVQTAKQADGTYEAAVVTALDHAYLVTENITSTVSDVTADTPSDLRNAANQADYLVIAPLHLHEAAQRLTVHRESQGLKTMLVDIEDVQDEFSSSLPAPEAVRDFLGYVHDSWAHVPTYVVLIGDGSYDYKNHLGYGWPQVPTVLTATPDGYFPGDSVLADVDGGDGVPEFAIGRIPAVDGNELAVYIDKVLSYEQASQEGGILSIVTDKADPAAGNFKASADKVAALAPNGFTVSRLDVDTIGESGASAKITDVLRQGRGILHYIGHSSVISYGRKGTLMTASGISSMNDIGAPMLMLSMSCSSAKFGYSPMSSIGETAVLRAEGAAVGFFGATGLSRNYLADIITAGFYSSLNNSGTARIGDAVLQAKQQYADQGAERYPLDIYNLLGDPAVSVPVKH